MMSPYSKKIYSLMMRELNIMGPYQIDRICKQFGINPFMIEEKDLPDLSKELSRAVLVYGGQESARRFIRDFSGVYNHETMIQSEEEPYKKMEHMMNAGDLHRLSGEWEEAMEHYKGVIGLAGEEQDFRMLCRANRKIGWILSNRPDFKAALEHLEIAEMECQKIEDPGQYGKCHREIAYLYWRKGEYDTALEHVENALTLARCASDASLLGELMIRRATVLADMGKFHGSIEQLREAVDILDHADDHINLSRAYNNMGVFNKYNDNLEEALLYFDRSLDAAKNTESPRSKAYPLANSAECMAKLGQVQTARERLEEAREIFERIGERFMLARIQVIEALIFDAEDRAREAQDRLGSGLDAFRKLGIPNDLAWELFEAAKLMRKWGVEDAADLFIEAEDIFKGLGNDTLAEKVRKESGL